MISELKFKDEDKQKLSAQKDNTSNKLIMLYSCRVAAGEQLVAGS